MSRIGLHVALWWLFCGPSVTLLWLGSALALLWLVVPLRFVVVHLSFASRSFLVRLLGGSSLAFTWILCDYGLAICSAVVLIF